MPTALRGEKKKKKKKPEARKTDDSHHLFIVCILTQNWMMFCFPVSFFFPLSFIKKKPPPLSLPHQTSTALV
jgi:hypothetical protein